MKKEYVEGELRSQVFGRVWKGEKFLFEWRKVGGALGKSITFKEAPLLVRRNWRELCIRKNFFVPYYAPAIPVVAATCRRS